MGKGARKKDNLKREFSAGGAVFKEVKGKGLRVKVLWLVTKSTSSQLYPKGVWRLPKGWLDDEGGGTGTLASGQRKAVEEELQEAAIREVREEGGVKTQIVSKIGTERYFFQSKGERILKFVTFYLMEWIDDILEGPGFETEEVSWLPYSKARKKLSYSGEKKILDKARGILDSGIPF